MISDSAQVSRYSWLGVDHYPPPAPAASTPIRSLVGDHGALRARQLLRESLAKLGELATERAERGAELVDLVLHGHSRSMSISTALMNELAEPVWKWMNTWYDVPAAITSVSPLSDSVC